MLRWLIGLVLVFFIFRAISRLLHGIAEGMGPSRPEPPAAVPLARDPVCGTFVVPSRALTAGRGADLRFFCSEKCLRAYEMTLARQASAGGKPPQAAATLRQAQGRPEQGRGTSAQRDGERQRGPIEQSE